ncbi:hypothetical protein TSUD_02860 [Trifolium subterraneum]|uniref:glycerophosphodiester phosphodiesterase n=1 Tax=Trifolium subterraneum TaxID=3900 RepID=A0A2Z6MA09_TRISU|nr:hypothetical protein TSUD_02860 [Trifolium subterraneum]
MIPLQHDEFYGKHNFSMRRLALSLSRRVHYISSPEVGFLKSIKFDFNPKKTKLVFRFMNENDTDPSSNHTYGLLSKNPMFIKVFASGIMVPKKYIWSEAHKIGLHVFGTEFANDKLSSYNYNHDPLAKYLQFVDNGDFSVDGVLYDFPITASEAIGANLFALTFNYALDKTLIISIANHGASGDYLSCTDLSYKQAILDDVDGLDCPFVT